MRTLPPVKLPEVALITIGVLVATRIVQGVGAGLVSPAALAGAVSGFPPERRGGALGIWGASAGVSNLLGPVIGGVLTVAFGWRADWWALVPLALVSAWAILRLLPPTARGEELTPRHTVFNRVVMAATLIAALTFAVMIGAFYLAEPDAAGGIELVLAAAYGLGSDSFDRERFAVGEGLVGQAAFERKTIALTELPPGYIEIGSGLGAAPAAGLLVMPVLFEDQVLGVIELASLRPFSEVNRDFLDRLTEASGLPSEN